MRFMAFLRQCVPCPGIYLVNLTAIFAIVVASVFGMWVGAKWGWWTMIFAQIYSFLDTIRETVERSVLHLQSELFTSSEVIPFAVRVGFSSLWILYFFTDDVLAFFQQYQERKLLKGSCIFLAAGAVVAIRIGLEIALRTI